LLEEIFTDFRSTLGPSGASPETYYTLGLISAILGKSEEAEQAYKKAIEARPDYWGARYSLGVLYAEKGRYDKASGELMLALGGMPGSLRIYRKIAHIYHQQGDHEEEIRIYRTALEKLSNHPHAYLLHEGLGLAYYATKNYEQAISELRKALEWQPHDPHIRVNLGTAYLATGKTDQAVQEFTNALELKPDLLSALRNLGTFYLRTGQFEGAVEMLLRAVAVAPSDANTHRKLALAYQKKHVEAKAQEHMRKAIELEQLSGGGTD
jgi:tetratricopeptide (TPR) repeat protein